MLCKDFENRLQRLLDQRQKPEADKTLCAHAECCHECCGLLDAQVALFAGLAGSSPEPPSLEFAEDVIAEYARTASIARRSPWLIAVGALTALAASWMLISLSGNHSPLRPGVATETGLSSVNPGVRSRPDPNPYAANDRSGDAEEYRRVLHELIARFSDTRFENLETVDQIAGGLRPLAMTLNAALDALRRSLPGSSWPESNLPGAGATESRNPGDSASLRRFSFVG